MNRHTPRLLAALLLLAPLAARAEVDIDAKAKAVAQSLVIVDYTIRTENGTREDSGQGILLSKDGVILIAGSLIPESLPKEWLAEIKVRAPGNNFTALPAKLLGRTRNRLFAYLKTDTPVPGTPFVPGEMKDVKMGQQVFSAAISGSSGGYTTYTGKSDVRALIEISHTLCNTGSFGLTRGTSPVFDLATGNLVGLTLPALGESMLIRDGSTRRIELLDDEQSNVFLPPAEVKAALTNIPDKPFETRRPWLAVDDLTGLQEDFRTLKKITQPSGIVVGSVIPKECADLAGLKAQDIILTLDGKEFSKNPVPEIMVTHFARALDDKQPGDKIVLGVLREGKTLDIPVTLGESPKISGEMPHIFSKIGVVTRDLVFADAYARHLPQDTKGVMIALVKSGTPASMGATPLKTGLMIIKVDDQPVESQQQFLDVMKQAEAKTDLKEMVFVVIQSTGEKQVCRIDLTK